MTWLDTSPHNSGRDVSLSYYISGNTLAQRWQQQHPHHTTDQSYMRKFGGEPDDGSALSDKMQAMFDSMDWMD